MAKFAILLSLSALLGSTFAHGPNEKELIRSKRQAGQPGAHEKCAHIFNGRQACTLMPVNIEGPYYMDDRIFRSNITEGLPGVPLKLHLQVLNYTTCEPVPNVVVDLWNCDTLGEYSGWNANDPTDMTSFRGFQVTNTSGWVTFDTIFPGWYEQRATHLHLDAWVMHSKHIGRIFFEEWLNAIIELLQPYNQIQIYRTKNEEDGDYYDFNGWEMLLTLNPASDGNGFEASMILGFEDEAEEIELPTMGPRPSTTTENSTNV